jgi:predicted acetyltransferase
MAASTSLQPITTSGQRQVAERLWQLYRHDLSEFRGYLPDSSGRCETTRLLSFFADPDRRGYLAYRDQAPVAFALPSRRRTRARPASGG